MIKRTLIITNQHKLHEANSGSMYRLNSLQRDVTVNRGKSQVKILNNLRIYSKIEYLFSKINFCSSEARERQKQSQM